jgi:hypothetical protein
MAAESQPIRQGVGAAAPAHVGDDPSNARQTNSDARHEGFRSALPRPRLLAISPTAERTWCV